jgi:hypothetical protein
VLPLLLQVVQCFLAFPGDATVVLDLELAVPADVAKVRGDRPHAAAAAGDLDHDLGRTTHRRLDVPADRGRPSADSS